MTRHLLPQAPAGQAGRGAWAALIGHHAPAVGLMSVVVLLPMLRIFNPALLLTGIHHSETSYFSYVLAWGRHTLLSNPAAFYNLPIFYPDLGMTALNDSMPLVSLLSLPFSWFFPMEATFNLTLLLLVLLASWGAYALAYELTGQRRASVLAGVVFAANGDVQWHITSHPNMIGFFLMPITMLVLVRLARRPTPLLGAALAASLIGQALCGWYLGFINLFGAAMLGALLFFFGAKNRPQFALQAGFGFLLALVVLYALSAPYREVSDLFGSHRGLHDMTRFSADVFGYLLPPHAEWHTITLLGNLVLEFNPPAVRPENGQYFGLLTILAVVVFPFWLWRRRREKGSGILLALYLSGIAIFIYSLGPFFWWGERLTGIPLPAKVAFDYIAPIRFLRSVARFAVFVSLIAAVVVAVIYTHLKFFQTGLRRRQLSLFALILVVYTLDFFPVYTVELKEQDDSARRLLERNAQDIRVVAFHPFFDFEMFQPLEATLLPTTSGHFLGTQSFRFGELMALFTDYTAPHHVGVLAASGATHVLAMQPPAGEWYYRHPSFELVDSEAHRTLFRMLPVPDEWRQRGRELLDEVTWSGEATVFEREPHDGDFLRRRFFPEEGDDGRRFRHRELTRPWRWILGAVPILPGDELLVELRTRQRGMDLTRLRAGLIPVDGGGEISAVATGLYAPDGTWQRVRVPIPREFWFRDLETIEFTFTESGYPGLNLWVREVGIIRPGSDNESDR